MHGDLGGEYEDSDGEQESIAVYSEIEHWRREEGSKEKSIKDCYIVLSFFFFSSLLFVLNPTSLSPRSIVFFFRVFLCLLICLFVHIRV